MAIYDVGDIQTETLVRLGVSTTASGFYTDTQLNDWTRQAHRFCANFKKWALTEGRSNTTYAITEEWNYPEGWRPDSIRILQVGGKRLTKLNFEDYQIFREESPSGDDRVWSDFGLIYFINPNVDSSGTLTVWGQFTPALDPTDKTATTVFSNVAEEGNEAIVNEIISYAKFREQKLDESTNYHNLAISHLNKIWKEIEDEAFGYQPHPDRGGMFRRFNVLTGRDQSDEVKRDQF